MERRNCAYAYVTPGIYKAPVQEVGEMFAEMADNNNLTPQAVVDASRPDDALLHNEFEWNDTVAAEAYRQVQAAKLIRSVTVVKTTYEDDGAEYDVEEETTQKPEDRVRAFAITPGRTHNYARIDSVMNDETNRAYLLELAKSDLRAFSRKYRKLTELADVIGAIDEFFTR